MAEEGRRNLVEKRSPRYASAFRARAYRHESGKEVWPKSCANDRKETKSEETHGGFLEKKKLGESVRYESATKSRGGKLRR